MKTILLDIDGVVADFDSVVVDFVKDFGIDLDISKDIFSKVWDITDIPEVTHLHDDIWAYILDNKGVIRNVNPFAGAYDFVQELRKLGDVVACTASIYPGNFSSERAAWLMDEFNFERSDIIFASKKHMVQADFLIDDKSSNIINWALNWENSQAIHFQTPGRFPSGLDAMPGNAHYCKTYEEVLDIVK